MFLVGTYDHRKSTNYFWIFEFHRKLVRIGDLDLKDSNFDGSSPVDIPVEEIILHPEYSASPKLNDIALLRLRKHVTFTGTFWKLLYIKFHHQFWWKREYIISADQIRTICIASEPQHRNDVFYYNKSPLIAGWGRATEGRSIFQHFLISNDFIYRLVSQEDCPQIFWKKPN